MDDTSLEARFSAIEFLLDGLWAKALCGLPEHEAQAVIASLKERAGHWRTRPEAGPQDVAAVQARHELAQAWTLLRIGEIERLLQAFRASA